MSDPQLRAIGTLVAGIAHELNTPLGALNSNHDVLKRALHRLQEILADDRVEDHELEELRRVVKALDGIMRVNDLAVERMVQLVTSMRNFGRIDGADRSLIDVHPGIESSIALLSHQFQDRIIVERQYGALPPIECYPNQLSQVWMNLLVNAGHAIQGPGTVTIRTQAAADHVVVSISDTGSGIPAADFGRIFEPGFTTKGGRIGMGLGLLIVKQIVARHGGHIAVRSEEGHGSTFDVTLPTTLPV